MRAKAFVILWVGAAIAATTIAWQGVSIVDSQVISPAPAISTARSSAAVIPVAPAPTATSAPTATPEEAADVEPELVLDLSSLEESAAPSPGAEERAEGLEAVETPDPTGDPGGAITPPTPRPTTAPRNTTPPSPSATPTATPRPQPSPTPTVALATPTATLRPTATPPPEPAQTLTFDLIGGTASVSFAPDEVHVLWATPEPGFSAAISDSGPGQRVEFRSDAGESRLDVWWDAGPQWAIDEDHD